MRPSSKLVQNVVLPQFVYVEQNMPNDALDDIATDIFSEFERTKFAKNIKQGQRVAIAVGSRGIANLPLIVRSTIDWFKSQNTHPFIVPAMGSHGQANAEGQEQLLAELGITEESVGCPILSSMEVVTLGSLDNGFNVYMDRNAFLADSIFVINRVKPHTSFRGPHESGLVKMVTIGLGKQVGAESCHVLGYKSFPKLLPEMAAVSLEKSHIIGGLALIENALDKTCLLEVVSAQNLLVRDAELLRIAMTKMPSLLFNQIDVLIIDEMGKNISGGGMDYNVVGRYFTEGMTGGAKITKLGVLDITQESHGNGIGMGIADFITERLRGKLDFEAAYVNALTSTVSRASSMPPALATDEDVFKAAVKTCNVPKTEDIRFVRIQNTLMLRYMQISLGLLPEALEKGFKVIGEPSSLVFTKQGELTTRGVWPSDSSL